MEGINLSSPFVQQMMAEHPPTPEQAKHLKFCYGEPPKIQTERIVETGNGQSPQVMQVGEPRYITTTASEPAYGVRNFAPGNNVIQRQDSVAQLQQMINQSAQEARQQPYADPYGMITGAGMVQYQLPVYNFTGALASPGYVDNNQPVMGSGYFVPGMPIQGYSNPYMQQNGFGVTGYDPRYAQQQAIPMYGYNPYGTPTPVNNCPLQLHPMEPERQRRYMYGTDQDRWAINLGFDSYIDKYINDERLYSYMHISVMKSNGATPEEIKEYENDRDAYFEELRKKDNEFDKSIDPWNLDRYKVSNIPERRTSKMKVRIMRGDEVILEMNGDTDKSFDAKPFVDKGHELAIAHAQASIINQIERNRKDQLFAQMYANAPERQFDHVGIVDFFNKGLNYLYRLDQLRELDRLSHDVTKLYDRNFFQQKLHENNRPQTMYKAYEQKRKEEQEANMNRVDSSFIPGGIEVNTGPQYNQEQRLMDGVFYDPSKGSITMTLPDYLDRGDYDPSFYDKLNGIRIADIQKDQKRRADFLNEVNNM